MRNIKIEKPPLSCELLRRRRRGWGDERHFHTWNRPRSRFSLFFLLRSICAAKRRRWGADGALVLQVRARVPGPVRRGQGQQRLGPDQLAVRRPLLRSHRAPQAHLALPHSGPRLLHRQKLQLPWALWRLLRFRQWLWVCSHLSMPAGQELFANYFCPRSGTTHCMWPPLFHAGRRCPRVNYGFLSSGERGIRPKYWHVSKFTKREMETCFFCASWMHWDNFCTSKS